MILRDFRCYSEDWKLPCFMSETHSSPYRDTVSQTAADVLDQFRLLYCFNPDILECVNLDSLFQSMNKKALSLT